MFDPQTPPAIITYIIIGITCIISFLAMQNQDIKNRYMFNAYAIAHHKQWWRFFTHGLLHADFGHLIFNMLSLYIFGRYVEIVFTIIFGSFGWVYYLVLYVSALFFSSLFSFFKHKDNSYYNALGASGTVSAIIFAKILLDP